MYRQLSPTHITETTALLRKRVEERFPTAGLTKVAEDLERLTIEAGSVSLQLGKPNYVIRAAAGVCILAMLTLLVIGIMRVRIDDGLGNASDFAQGIEATVNNFVFVSVAIYFLATLEVRLKRRRALTELHALRSMAHIIDMHQLTKDPERSSRAKVANTASSPQHPMTPFELQRYLDYCSEMLAIIGKVAALYIQHFGDSVTVSVANDIETLTAHLSGNVWQKILAIDLPAAPSGGDD